MNERSLQVVASPCWELALPDVSSTICVEVLGPIPRRVRPVRLPVSSRTTSASPHEGQVRHARNPLHYNFSQGSAFRGCSHSLMFRLLNLLDLQVVPTAGVCQGSQAFLHHAGPTPLPDAGSGIATYPTRAIGTAGLAPARLYSCRLLSPSLALFEVALHCRELG